MAHAPTIRRTNHGYDVYLDSPLGYVFQATFDSLAEASEWASENANSLWRV